MCRGRRHRRSDPKGISNCHSVSSPYFLKVVNDACMSELAATLRWFTAGGAIRIAVRQLLQTWKLRHYDVIDDVITRKL